MASISNETDLHLLQWAYLLQEMLDLRPRPLYLPGFVPSNMLVPDVDFEDDTRDVNFGGAKFEGDLGSGWVEPPAEPQRRIGFRGRYVYLKQGYLYY